MESKKHICKYCSKEFETSQKLGGHVSRCKLNPNYKEIFNKIGKKIHNNANFKEYTFICEYCGKEFTNLDNNSNQYCSNECMRKGRSKKLSESAKRNKFGGLNPNTTHKHYKRGYYNNIWCDSSWELAFVVYCLEHNISVKRNTTYKEYSFENKIYKFYPDFIINDNELVEIKGFITPKNKAKIEQVSDVTFIYKSEIQPYINYVINKYGNKFYDLLYNK